MTVELRARIVNPDELSAASLPGEHDLAVFTFEGVAELPPAEMPKGPPPSRAPLNVRIPLRQILVDRDGGPTSLRWTSNAPAHTLEQDGFRCARTEDYTIGWTTADAPDATGSAREIYSRLLELLRNQAHPNLLRVWNVLPRIHDEDARDGESLERYMAFCRGRAEAFDQVVGNGFETNLPAASAVGSPDGGPLMVAFLAGRTPAQSCENPRQMAAWQYPLRYGPRPPSFARALREEHAGSPLLLSGTASIVGHESVHPGDVAAQTRETIRNLDTLCAGRQDGPPCELEFLQVFVREPEHARTVEAELRERYGEDLRLLFLQADVCRRELLVEIEGVGAPVAVRTR